MHKRGSGLGSPGPVGEGNPEKFFLTPFFKLGANAPLARKVCFACTSVVLLE